MRNIRKLQEIQIPIIIKKTQEVAEVDVVAEVVVAVEVVITTRIPQMPVHRLPQLKNKRRAKMTYKL